MAVIADNFEVVQTGCSTWYMSRTYLEENSAAESSGGIVLDLAVRINTYRRLKTGIYAETCRSDEDKQISSTFTLKHNPKCRTIENRPSLWE
ncbi:hypothetical protein P879_05427 [Paragonimus westermani]|uniref:Uncharacterized protein n=1 Tax=Paragonimus westermani TaxID=34504 RepID=A0A8T0DJC3_9TREM|nr:hypothetical protein P879_05427 [Paragonimus westermani]